MLSYLVAKTCNMLWHQAHRQSHKLSPPQSPPPCHGMSFWQAHCFEEHILITHTHTEQQSITSEETAGNENGSWNPPEIFIMEEFAGRMGSTCFPVSSYHALLSILYTNKQILLAHRSNMKINRAITLANEVDYLPPYDTFVKLVHFNSLYL